MTETKILEKLKTRNQRALEEAIYRFNGYAAAVIFNTGGNSLSREDMEEIADDVFLAVWENALSIKVSLKAYIRAIARNKTLDRLRTLKPTEEIPDNCVSDYGNPEEVTENNYISGLVYNEIVALGSPDTEIFFRYFYSEQKLREIAEETGLGLSAVKMRVKRGKERLRKAIVQNGVSL